MIIILLSAIMIIYWIKIVNLNPSNLNLEFITYCQKRKFYKNLKLQISLFFIFAQLVLKEFF
jgi:hypothetical protein